MLEKNGALLTWSINDILPLRKSGSVSAAVRLPNHRIDYLAYQGKISRGRGSVKIFDKGNYSFIGRCAAILLRLNGKIIKGNYCMVDIDSKWWIIKA
jgi:hypothetical protein